jgi:hypothetical protein
MMSVARAADDLAAFMPRTAQGSMSPIFGLSHFPVAPGFPGAGTEVYQVAEFAVGRGCPAVW